MQLETSADADSGICEANKADLEGRDAAPFFVSSWMKVRRILPPDSRSTVLTDFSDTLPERLVRNQYGYRAAVTGCWFSLPLNHSPLATDAAMP